MYISMFKISQEFNKQGVYFSRSCFVRLLIYFFRTSVDLIVYVVSFPL